MNRRAALFLFAACVVGCDGPTRSTDPAEIARAARAAKRASAGTPNTVGPGVELLYFTADWCGPCQAVKPIFRASAADFPDVPFRELDIDQPENGELVERYRVRPIPHFLVVSDGQVVGSHVGPFRSKEELGVFVRTHRRRAAGGE